MRKAIFELRGATKHTLFLALSMLTFDVQALSPSQVFDKVKESVVVVKTLDAKGKTIGQGSGVLLPSGKIGTNCHVVKNGASFQVGGGKQFVMAIVWGSDEDKDICLLDARGLTAKPAQLGQAMRLKVGEPVYAVGAPRGLELSLSDGIVSQLRGGPPPLIQTTAAISPGSSGGGLFDAEGRLVGFTALYIEGGQSLNFAMPVEWAGEIQPGTKAAQGRSETDWSKRAIAFHDAENWTGLRDWCQRWTQAQPGNGSAWFYLGNAFHQLQRHTEAIDAYRQAVRIYPDDASAWSNLGLEYRKLKRHTEAIEAFRQKIRIDSKDARAWLLLGGEYGDLQRHTEAIDAYRQAVRIDPKYANAWFLLVVEYEQSGNHKAALEAVRQLRRIDPVRADELLADLTAPPPVVSSSATAGWVAVSVAGENDTVYANPSTIRRSGNMVKLWTLADFQTPHKFENGKPYRSTKAQVEYDCKEEQARVLFVSDYSGSMGEGEVVNSQSGPAEWRPVSPGSRSELLWKFACRNSQRMIPFTKETR